MFVPDVTLVLTHSYIDVLTAVPIVTWLVPS